METNIEKITRDDLRQSINLLRVMSNQKPSREMRLAAECAMRALRWLNKATYVTVNWELK